MARVRELGILRTSEMKVVQFVPSETQHNLPTLLTSLVGRDKEQKTLADLLAVPSNRLITLHGIGGIGKTHLALEVAHQQIEYFTHGVYFVTLAPISSGKDIIPSIAETIGFQGQGNIKKSLLKYLRSKKILIILDNFEHLTDHARIISEILSSAKQVKILVTSREKLKLSGEILCHVDGIGFPEILIPKQPERYSSVQLFIQHAQKQNPDFEPTDEELQNIAHICRFIQGVPLGILMAASWLNVLSVEDIATEITKNLDLFETNNRDMPDRHRSMRYLFEHSWSLLSETERQIYIKLSIFRGGFTREAAEAVAGASLHYLSNLVNKSMVQWIPLSKRYDLHALARQYAHERLIEVGLLSESLDAHRDHFFGLIQDEGHI